MSCPRVVLQLMAYKQQLLQGFYNVTLNFALNKHAVIVGRNASLRIKGINDASNDASCFSRFNSQTEDRCRCSHASS